MRKYLDRFTGNLSAPALLVSIVFWSWFDLVPLNPLLAHVAGAQASPFMLAWSLLCSAVVLSVFVASRSVRRKALRPAAFALAALVAGSLGTLAAYMGYRTGSASALLAGSLLVGVFQGFGIAVSGSIIVCQGKTNALIHMAAYLPFNVVFILLGMFLQPSAAVVLCCLLPVLSALCFKVYLERGKNAQTLQSVTDRAADESEPNGQGAASVFSMRWIGLGALLFAITFAFGYANCQVAFFEAPQFPGLYFDQMSLAIRAVVAAVVFVEYVFRGRQPLPLLFVAVGLMSAGLVLLGALGEGSMAGRIVLYSLFYVGFAVFDLLIWAILVILHRETRMSMLRFLCAAQAIDQFGIFAGTSARSWLVGPGFTMAAFTITGVLLLALVFVTYAKSSVVRQNLHIDFDVDEHDIAPDGENASSRDSETVDAPVVRPESFPSSNAAQSATDPETSSMPAAVGVAASEKDRRVEALISRYFLTEREAAIAHLLAEGRSVPYIASALVVSQNTVKTHVRHIYAKTDVHTRQEFFDLLEHPDL